MKPVFEYSTCQNSLEWCYFFLFRCFSVFFPWTCITDSVYEVWRGDLLGLGWPTLAK